MSAVTHLPATPTLDAEQQLIGAVLVRPALLEDPDVARLTPADFALPAHARIWDLVASLADTHQGIDPISVANAVRALPSAQATPGLNVAYVADLHSRLTVTAAAPGYATDVRLAATKRRVAALSQRMFHALEDAGTEQEVDDVIAKARAHLDTLAAGHRRPALVTLDAAVDAGIGRSSETTAQTRTPWHDLNKLIGGWQPGRLYVIGARPGAGKSITGINAALHMAHQHHRAVALSTLEMDHAEIGQRTISAMGEVNFLRLQSGSLTESEWSRVARVSSEVADAVAQVYIDDAASVRPAQVRAHARAVARACAGHGTSLGMIVVDYLQLMEGSGPTGGRAENRQQEVAAMSRAMKVTARDLGVPVLLLSQLNRGSEARGPGASPRLSDLRDSGAVEQDADVVLLLHRDTDGAPDDLEINVAKNRQGPMGRFQLRWQGQYMRVTSQ